MTYNLLHSIHAYDMTKQYNKDRDRSLEPSQNFTRITSTMPWKYIHDTVTSILGDDPPNSSMLEILSIYEILDLERNGTGPFTWQVPSGWTHEVRYMYSELYSQYRRNATDLDARNHLSRASGEAISASDVAPVRGMPRLIHTRVTTRDGTPSAVSSEVHVYRYRNVWSRFDATFLEAFYEPDTVARFIREGRLVKENGQVNTITSSLQLVTEPMASSITLPDTENTTVRIQMPLRAAADWMRELGNSPGPSVEPPQGFYRDQEIRKMINHVGLPPYTLFHLGHPIRSGAPGPGRHSAWTVLGSNDSSGKRRYIRVFHFLVNSDIEFANAIPSLRGGLIGSLDSSQACHYFYGTTTAPGTPHLHPGTTIFYHPYQWHEPRQVDGSITDAKNHGTEYAPMFKTRWVSVVDEYDSYEDAIQQNDSPPVGVALGKTPLSRRILHFNPRGHKLHEETWDMRTGAIVGDVASINERYAYDNMGRVIAIFGPGHRNVHGQADVFEGHIRVFKYLADGTAGQLANPIAEGVANQLPFPPPEGGYADTAVKWQRQFWFHPERPDLITEAIEFETPPSALLTARPAPDIWRGADWVMTSRTDLKLEVAPTPPPPPSNYKFAIGANGRRLEPPRVVAQSTATPIEWGTNGPTLYAVQREAFDEEGRSQWRGSGSVTIPGLLDEPSGGNGVRYSISYSEYDSLGRETARAEDTSEDSLLIHVFGDPPPNAPKVPPPPSQVFGGFARAHPDTALHHLTTWKHGPYGPTEKIDPNKLGTAWRYTPIGEDLEIGTYTRLTRNGADRVSIGTGTLMRMSGGSQPQAHTVEEVEWTGPIADPPNPAGPKQVLRTITPAYDKGGALAGAKIESPDTPTMEMSATSSNVNIGGMLRVVDVHGGITRTVSDRYGQPELIFRGTRDGSGHWRQSTEDEPDDMLLVEKRFYGTGPKDALLQVESRMYREKVETQFNIGGGPAANQIGMPTATEYDSRRRPVATVQYAAGTARPTAAPWQYPESARRTRTNTFYDHLDRPVFVAEYGQAAETSPARPSPDPAEVAMSSPLPAVSEFFTQSSDKPIALTEYVYDSRGLVIEERQYDVGFIGTGARPFQVVRTEYDFAGRPVRVQSPGNPIQETVYDAQGRITATREIGVHGSGTNAKLVVLQETKLNVDVEGNVTVRVTRERRHDASPDIADLNALNSVWTAMFHWYDAAGRLIATADLGAGQAETFSNGGVAPPTAGQRPFGSPPGADPREMQGGVLVGIRPLGEDFAHARTTATQYDNAGRAVRELAANGSLTVNQYDGHGRITLRAEGSLNPGPEGVRVTLYRYGASGQLEAMAATRAASLQEIVQITWAAPGAGAQITEINPLIRAARVVREVSNGGLDDVAANTELSGAFMLGTTASIEYPPDEGQGVAPTPDKLFSYYMDGLLAKREFQGITHSYFYDDLSRLARIDVAYSPASPQVPPPQDRIVRVTYAYSPKGDMAKVRAYRTPTSSEENLQLVAETEFKHDAYGRLVEDVQAHGTIASNNTPRVTYLWRRENSTLQDLLELGNYDVLERMEYPKRYEQAGNRVITFGFEGSGTLDARLGRVRSVSQVTPARTLAEFEYTGSGRVVARRMAGAGDAATIRAFAWDPIAAPPSAAYVGLNRFGQPHSHHVRQFNNAGVHQRTIYRGEHRYDRAGRIVYTERTDQTRVQGAFGQPRENQASSVYAHDGLDRLIGFGLGRLENPTEAPNVTWSLLLPKPFRVDWGMDTMGNLGGLRWNPDSDLNAGRTTSGQLDADTVEDSVREFHHVGDADEQGAESSDNSITRLTRSFDGSSPVDTNFVYDRLGRLVCDGEFFYQHDGWGRVIEVRRKGTLSFDANGKPSGGVAGARIIHYTYDGLGRLIRAQRPMPDDVNPLAPTRFRTERYFYDGVRRVQEVVTEDLPVIVIGDPIPMQGEAEITGEPELEEPGEPPPPVATLPWTGREYVYAPPSAAGMGPGHGGGSSAVDDFIAQVDNADAWVFMIQDVHGDVVALASETGAILARYAYDGFGRILLSEHDGINTGPQGTQSIKPTANRVGHKGLFFDRYDTPHAWVPGSGIDGLPPTLAAPTTGSVGQAGSWASGGVKGLYFNRNRHFSPNLGRFVQRDPNATGLVLAAVPAMHGQRVGISLQPFDAEFHYQDGPNTHAIYAGGPTLYSDPMGLIGIIGGLSTGMNMADMASDAMDMAMQGVTIQSRLFAMLANYADGQFVGATLSDIWEVPDDKIMFTAGAVFAGGITSGQKHHIIPRFMLGRQAENQFGQNNNLMRLTKGDHDKFHRLLEDEFKKSKLDPPNSKGDKNWRNRIRDGVVNIDESRRMQAALLRAARAFDTQNRQAGTASNMASRVRDLLNDPTLPDHLRNARTPGGGGRRRRHVKSRSQRDPDRVYSTRLLRGQGVEIDD
jgi:YD repeat-containing protein